MTSPTTPPSPSSVPSSPSSLACPSGTSPGFSINALLKSLLSTASAKNDVAESASDEQESAPGLHRYQLVKELGKGSFGCVYLARRRADNAACALKVVSKSSYPRDIDSFMDEVDILSQISHPTIIKLQSQFWNDSYLFMELECLTGGDLLQLLKRTGPLGTYKASFYISQLVLALDALHSISIIHRDIKPENILIDSQGYLKLSDFGLATKMEFGECYDPYGTFLYMAPELLTRQPYGIAVDWWALGVTLYVMVFGKLPFNVNLEGSNFSPERYQELIDLVQKPPLPFDGSLINHSCAEFLVVLLDPDPSKRELSLTKAAAFRWFRNINFVKLENRGYVAPIIPDQLQLPWDPTRPANEVDLPQDPDLEAVSEALANSFADAGEGSEE